MLRLAITSGVYTDLSNAANSSSAFSLLACSCALSAFDSRLAWASLSARLAVLIPDPQSSQLAQMMGRQFFRTFLYQVPKKTYLSYPIHRLCLEKI